ncbi:nuclear protein MDM1 isoform X1 [Scleropages formosus]|uniref:nuclear protein MDM1 isoform X1 n=1 Tax=Scleropages formosus TaxID=113540 RepID=UPI0010FABD73|nr:nuclear protein MDM1 isoform X1 [Scleropages formosus]
MPVRFKGVSEYQKKFKGQTAQSGGASFHPGTRQAGLRSDQLGITKEPQFLSKKKVPLHRPQVSRSLECKELVDPQWHPQDLEVHRPSPPLAETPERPGNSREPQASLASRGLQPPEILSTHHALDALPHLTPPEPEEPKQLPGPKASSDKFEAAQNGVHRGLRTRAGFRTKDHKGGLYSSEYQRQFLWKAPAVSSPLLAAEQNERRRKEKMKKKKQHSRKGSLQNGLLQQPTPPRSGYHSDVELLEDRKLKTEYNSNYRSPLQYRYKDGIWMKARTAGDEGRDSNHSHMWYEEVRELREKAEAYRKRAWGTHFSRDHLSQILSEHNQLWEASTTSSAVMDLHGSSPLHALDLASVRSSAGSRTSVSSVASQRNSVGDGMDQGLHDVATLPVQKRLAWEDATKGDGPELKSQLEREQEKEKQHSEKQEEEVINKQDTDNEVRAPGIQHLSLESISDTSRDEGRVPTPKLKTIAVVPRTHHDLTTPVTGGAILVSPLKLKDPQSNFQRSETPLGRAFKHVSQTSIHQEPGRVDDSGSVQVSPAVGLSTLDPIPLREDFLETELHPEDPPAPCHDRSFQKHNGCGPSHLSITAPAVRIQGKLRDPEFQHNGNLGLRRSELFAFPSTDLATSEDDRMSLISSMSAASCSFASQVLARAQKRKEDFWGKN